MLERHVRLRLETNAGAEDVGQGSALLGQGIDDGGARRGHRSLEHVAQNAEDAVEVLVVGAVGLPLDARHHLGENDEIDDEGRREKRILADVEKAVDCQSKFVFSVRAKRKLTRWFGGLRGRSQRSTRQEHACCRQQRACT